MDVQVTELGRLYKVAEEILCRSSCERGSMMFNNSEADLLQLWVGVEGNRGWS
jgi:hypothetical protein